MTTTDAVVLPTSFLYVPASKPALFAKAAAGAAGAIVLDLEDAVPVQDKDQARHEVQSWLAGAPAHEPDSAQTWVRVDAAALDDDLSAAVHRSLSGIFLAKCTAEAVDRTARLLDDLEASRDVAPGSIRIVGLVESAQAMLELRTMATARRLTTFGIGEADLLADLRMSRSPESQAALDGLRAQVVVHCAAAGRPAPVAPTSTDFRDLDTFASTSRALLGLGFRSRTAIHPAQVPVINELFAPTAAEVAAARDVLARFAEAAEGVTVDAKGRLIDAAVVRGARETLARART